MNPKISPSIASSNLMNIEQELLKTNACDNLHVDIEDGNFVPNITFGLKFVRQLRSFTNLPFSIHLMCNNPYEYLESLSELNCSHIFVHAEGQMYLRRLLVAVKKTGSKVGLAVNPSSNIMDYDYALDLVDSVLYMTSEPDNDGELFIDSIVKKLVFFSDKEIWLDGGINEEVLSKLPREKIDYVVKGRAFFNDSLFNK